MDNVLVSEGDIVLSGQVLGGVGQPSIFGSLLGPHVNFYLTRDDYPVNPHYVLMARE